MVDYYNDCITTGKIPKLEIVKQFNLKSTESRTDFIHNFGFPLVTNQEINLITKYSKNILSVGCGTGYIDTFLRSAGCNIISTDPVALEKNDYGFIREYGVIKRLSADKAISRFPARDILLSWPCYNHPWAYEAIKDSPPGKLIIYIGESIDGCTGDEQLHDFFYNKCQMIAQSNMPQWWAIHDILTIYKRGESK